MSQTQALSLTRLLRVRTTPRVVTTSGSSIRLYTLSNRPCLRPFAVTALAFQQVPPRSNSPPWKLLPTSLLDYLPPSNKPSPGRAQDFHLHGEQYLLPSRCPVVRSRSGVTKVRWSMSGGDPPYCCLLARYLAEGEGQRVFMGSLSLSRTSSIWEPPPANALPLIST